MKIRLVPSLGLISILLVAVVAACCSRQKISSKQPTVAAASVAAAASNLRELPHVTLVALSDWQGVLKPCGCTVDLQRGGVERIAAYLERLRGEDDSVVLVHAGALLTEDQSPPPRRVAQRNLRVATFARILDGLDVDAVAVSSPDLKRGGQSVRKAYADSRWPLVATGWNGGLSRAVASRLIRTASGVRVGVLSIDRAAAADPAGHVEVVDKQAKALRAKGAQIVVLLSNLGLRSSRKLARKAAALDVVVIGGIPARSEALEAIDRDGRDGATLIVYAPRQGAYMAVVTLALNGDGRWREVGEYLPDAVRDLQERLTAQRLEIERMSKGKQTVATERALPFFEKRMAETGRKLAMARAARDKTLPSGRLVAYTSVGLSWSATPDVAVVRQVARYNAEVARINETAAARPLPAKAGRASYVGHDVCVACHLEVVPFAKTDLHYTAWKTLERLEKTRDLDCVPCHSTGFGQPGGSAFDNIGTFANVQCEACHGPGSKHVDAPGKGSLAHIVASPKATVCVQCHSPEHAPRFAFDAYRKRLIVPGHGLPVVPTP
jgi:hypothetical protein